MGAGDKDGRTQEEDRDTQKEDQMTDHRDERGYFLPGNPIKGGRNKGPTKAEQVRAMIEPHAPEIIAKAVELAKAGDPAAMRLCLERLAPMLRPEDEKVLVPGLKDAPTLAAKATAILAAVADGEVSAAAADRLLKMLDTFGRCVVLDDHGKRLALIEAGRLPQPVALGFEDLA